LSTERREINPFPEPHSLGLDQVAVQLAAAHLQGLRVIREQPAGTGHDLLLTISMTTSPGGISPVPAQTHLAGIPASLTDAASAGPEVSTVNTAMSPISRAQATGCRG
jgi:hypothetical protein